MKDKVQKKTKSKAGQSPIRLNLELSHTTYDVLSRVQERWDCASKVEAIRRALSLAETVQECCAKGGKVYIEYEDGRPREVLLII